MKNALKRLLSCVAVVMMVFALGTTAFAADSQYYSGSCNNNFFTSTAVTDLNATMGRDNNDSASYNTITVTDYTSRAYKYNTTNVPSMGVLKMSDNALKYGELTTTSSSYYFKFSNSYSGYKLTVTGYWRVY